MQGKPEVLFNPKLQNFFSDYLEKSLLINEVNEIFFKYIGYIIQNLSLNSWFYASIYSIIVGQFCDTKLDDQIRFARVRFLWEIYRVDENRRDEILEYVITVIEKECMIQEKEVCKYIFSSYPHLAKEDLIKRLSRLSNRQVLEKFFK